MESNSLQSEKEYEIKIYKLDTSHRNLKDFRTNHQIINYMVRHHKTRIDEIESLNDEFFPITIEDIDYYTYVYNEPEKKAHWDSFLPKSLKYNLDFSLVRLSFVLFACIDDKIFAVIGGGGSMVIKKFQDHRFGLDFYEYLTTLDEEIVSITTRGISGTLMQNNRIFKEGQRLSDVLNFVNIPTNINLVLKQEILDTYFPFINFGSKSVQLEISSYFRIKHKISFSELHQLFQTMNEVMNSQARRSLSSFIEIKDKKYTEDEFVRELLRRLRDDMFNSYSETRGENPLRFDIDFVHPSKTTQFYECDRFEIKTKGKNPDSIEVFDRNKIYQEGLRFVYNKLEQNATQYDFNKIMWGLKVNGYKGNDTKKYVWANFYQYVTCEIKYESRPVFQINSKWFYVKDEFTSSINLLCNQMINRHYSKSNLLPNSWLSGISEGDYNSTYKDETNYWVFDKALGQNIELCDIMVEEENTIYLIHVKTGFDAKIRDLSNQLVISANRFMISRNAGDNKFLNEVVDAYNNRKENRNHKITDKVSFINKFYNSQKEIVFIMAFKSDTKRVPVIRNNVEKLDSNIAKFSLIQCIREMSTYNYPIEIIEISN
jgi:hypothetical protein